ncbi:retrotransposable element Tf2 protein type 1 [Trichonephila clavipes]|nr:retrotransposable element Tf2 protein type 1 [Trichonephila clavipes]
MGDLTQLIDKFQTIFSQNKYDVGCINLEPQRIHLISDLPISLRPYRNSQQESKEIQTQIEELLKAGFIRPSHSPYAAPVTLAYKKDEGKRSRLCIDYRKLNEITQKKYGLLQEVPVAEEPFEMISLDTVGGFNYHNSQRNTCILFLDIS